MIDQHDSNSPGDSLYKAIRAQLSAAPVILERVFLDAAWDTAANPLDIAARLTRQHRAAIVFWIDTDEPYTIYFYMSDGFGGRINSRTLDINLSSKSGRFEVVAVVASSMIEGLLVSRNINDSASRPQEPLPAPSVPNKSDTAKGRRWVELFAAYSGSLFTAGDVTHGVTAVGVGLFPIERMAVAASFTQSWPLRFVNDELRLLVQSQQFELLAAGRIIVRPFDVRLGLAWSADRRSYSTTSRSDTINPFPDGTIWVHSLVPFVYTAWTYHERVGLFARVGAGIALNETVYSVKRDVVSTKAFAPFNAKLCYQFGFVVWI
jgi:hypothetical protein